jgi:hypothetical protein
LAIPWSADQVESPEKGEPPRRQGRQDEIFFFFLGVLGVLAVHSARFNVFGALGELLTEIPTFEIGSTA